MIVIYRCSWCKKHLYTKINEEESSRYCFSHGICEDCKELLMSELNEEVEDAGLDYILRMG